MNCPYLIFHKISLDIGNDNIFHLIMQTFCCIFNQCVIISNNQLNLSNFYFRRSFFEKHNGI